MANDSKRQVEWQAAQEGSCAKRAVSRLAADRLCRPGDPTAPNQRVPRATEPDTRSRPIGSSWADTLTVTRRAASLCDRPLASQQLTSDAAETNTAFAALQPNRPLGRMTTAWWVSSAQVAGPTDQLNQIAPDSTEARGRRCGRLNPGHWVSQAGGYRPRYTAVICSLSCPSSSLIVSRASRSSSRCAGDKSFDRGPPAAGAAQPVSSL